MLLFNITQIQQTLVYELRTLNSNVKVYQTEEKAM